MDLTQLSQMVSWLDEEHRRDREELAKLDQRQQGMVIVNQEQARRIQDLEGRLASTIAQLTRFADLEKSIQYLKNEVIALLDRSTEQRMQAEREAERARMNDREAIARSVGELRKDLGRLPPFEEELTAGRAEDQRLGEMLLVLRQGVNNVSRDLDERTRTLPYMVEQRTQDNKRIAALQAENVELLKRTETLATRTTLADEKIQRLERDLQKVQPVPEQIRSEQQAFLEEQRVADADRSRQMVVWAEAFVEQRAVLEKHVERLRDFQARYEEAGRAIASLEEFRAVIAREAKQVGELQRLSEERQRKELADWQSENEQRWKKESLHWEYVLQEQQKHNRKFAERFVPIEEAGAWLSREIEAIWRLQEALGGRHQSAAERLIEEISGALEGRKKLHPPTTGRQ